MDRFTVEPTTDGRHEIKDRDGRILFVAEFYSDLAAAEYAKFLNARQATELDLLYGAA